MIIRRFLTCAFLLGLVLSPSTSVFAHGGVSIDIDSCRIPVSDQFVHFTGYTPTVTADAEYCDAIPDLAQITNLVFDYEGRKLRNMTVEFEITKEPDGTRVYYQEPTRHKTGSINAVIDFTKHGASDYLAHVTLVNGEEKIDAHLPFSVGKGEGVAASMGVPLIGLFILLIALYFMVPAFKEKVDAVVK